MTQRIIGSKGSGRRKRWVWAAAGVSAVAVLLLVGSGGATLTPGSTFNTTNGDLTDTSIHDWNPKDSPTGNKGPIETINCGTAAQIPHIGTNCGTDLIKSTSDNAFGQGTKEDDLTPSVVFGSIPPQKDDLTRFYVNKEHADVTGCAPGTSTPNSCDYLYMAWERTNTLGSAHMDFEFNQKFCDVAAPTPTTCNSNNQTPVRTPGDALITFDFGGSGAPILALLRWVDATNGTSSDCYSASSVPCWGKYVDLTAAHEADASVNTANVTDNNPPNNPVSLSGSKTLDNKGNVKSIDSTFGEAGINLTGANLFPQGTCFHLGSAYLKSRSSGNSFTSEIKDFVAPIPVNISNCGEIIVMKQTDPRGIDKNFSITSDITGGQLADGTKSGVSNATCREAVSGYTNPYTLNDKDAGSPAADKPANTDDCANVPVGTYHINESYTDPTGFAFKTLVCTPDATSGSSATIGSTSTTNRTATINLKADGVVTCVYTNQQQLGAIKVTKTAKNKNCGGTTPPTGCSNGAAPLAGAGFEIWQENGKQAGLQTSGTNADSKVANEKSTDSSGIACFDGLSYNTAATQYYIHESTVPQGYSVPSNQQDQTTVISTNSSCSTGTPNPISVTNTPLSKIEVIFTSLGGAGVTVSSIVCTTGGTAVAPVSENGSADPAMDDTDETFTNLGIGTYTCTVVVDP